MSRCDARPSGLPTYPAPRAPRSGRASLAGLCGLFCLAVAPAVAHADLQLAVGSRVEPFRYTPAYFPNSGFAERPPSQFAGKTGPYQATSLSPYLGLFFAQRYGVMASFDVAYAKSAGEVQAPMMTPPSTDNNTFFQLGIALGLKVYITQPRASKVAPYVYADFYKYFASLTTDNTAITGEQAGAQAALLSPLGGTFAFGAEYFFSPGFSIGSEIFGLRIGHVNGDYREPNQTRHSNAYTTLSFYTGITLNFRFQVQASVKATDEEKDEDRSRRRSDYPPPPPVNNNPPPVPTPEAVD